MVLSSSPAPAKKAYRAILSLYQTVRTWLRRCLPAWRAALSLGQLVALRFLLASAPTASQHSLMILAWTRCQTVTLCFHHPLPSQLAFRCGRAFLSRLSACAQTDACCVSVNRW